MFFLNPFGLDASIARVKKFANSFVGADIADTRARLRDLSIETEPWEEDEIGGTVITATYPEFILQVYFHEGVAITTSIQVLSE